MNNDEVIAIRKRLGLSRKELVELMDIPYETLCRWENGKCSPSKFYGNQLRKLSGKRKPQKSEEKCIFVASNIQHVKNIVSNDNRRMFGTLHALIDPDESVFLTKVRLRPNAHAFNDLDQYISVQKGSFRTRRKRIIGFFVTANKQIRPAEHMVASMLTNNVFGASHCVIYNKAKEDIDVWKLHDSRPGDLKQEWVRSLSYLVVG